MRVREEPLDLDARILELRARGYSLRQIACEIGLSHTAVRKRLLRLQPPTRRRTPTPSKWKIVVKYDDKRKNPVLEVKAWGVIVVLPQGISESKAYNIIEKHGQWIMEKHSELLEALEKSRRLELIDRSEEEFRKLVEHLVEKASKDILGVNPCRIAIRKMKTRWASCSPRGTLTLNHAAKHLPERHLAYIIHHEICHILEPRHNNDFWRCVEKHYPGYKSIENELLAYELKLSLRGAD